MPRVKAQCGWCKNSKVRTNTLRSFAENPVWLIQNVELDSNLKFCPACHLALRKGNSRPDDAYKQRAMAINFNYEYLELFFSKFHSECRKSPSPARTQ